MKKIIPPIILTVLISIVFLFTGCSRSADTSDAVDVTATPEPGVTVSAQPTAQPSNLESYADKTALKVGIRNDAPGFAYLNIDTGEINGYEVDLIKAIGEILNKDIEFVVVSDSTREAALKNGDIDLIAATFTITDARKNDYLFTRPYYTDRLAFLVPKDSDSKSVSDLNGAKIGIASGTTGADDFQKAIDSKNISAQAVPFETFAEAKRALFANEIDAVFMDESILRSYQDGRVLDEYFTPQPYGIATLKENPQLIDAVDSAIGTLESDGTLKSIAEHWELKL